MTIVPLPPQRRAAKYRLILRFGIAGLVNTAFGYAVFALLLALGAGPLPSLICSATAGAVFNLQTSTRFVFRNRARTLRFFFVYAAILTINWAALWAAQKTGVNNFVAQALLAVPIAAIAFLAQRFFVFNSVAEAP